jgi:hypothetical protein
MSTFIKKIVDKINTDPDAGQTFLTTILLMGGFGIMFCLVWVYLMIKKGVPTGWIIFDSAVVIFCGWVIIKGIIPMTKKSFKEMNDKKNRK